MACTLGNWFSRRPSLIADATRTLICAVIAPQVDLPHVGQVSDLRWQGPFQAVFFETQYANSAAVIGRYAVPVASYSSTSAARSVATLPCAAASCTIVHAVNASTHATKPVCAELSTRPQPCRLQLETPATM